MNLAIIRNAKFKRQQQFNGFPEEAPDMSVVVLKMKVIFRLLSSAIRAAVYKLTIAAESVVLKQLLAAHHN